MLLPSKLSDLMMLALRRRKDPLDGAALCFSVLAHLTFLVILSTVRIQPARLIDRRQETLIKVHAIEDPRAPDDKPLKLAQLPKGTGAAKKPRSRPDRIKVHRKMRGPLLAKTGRGDGRQMARRPTPPTVKRAPTPWAAVKFAHKSLPKPLDPAKAHVTLDPGKTSPKPELSQPEPGTTPPVKPEVEVPPPTAAVKPEAASPDSAGGGGSSANQLARTFEDTPRPKPGKPEVTEPRDGGAGGMLEKPVEAVTPMPDPKSELETPAGPIGIPDGRSEKAVAAVPGAGPRIPGPGEAPRGAGSGTRPGDMRVARRSGDGGGVGARPASPGRRGGGRRSDPPLMARAGGPGEPDLRPGLGGPRGGSERSGDGKAAPDVPEPGSGGDIRTGGITDPGPGRALPKGGGDPFATAPRRGGGPPLPSSWAPASGTGPRIPTAGGDGGGSVFADGGPGAGGTRPRELPGGGGGPEEGYRAGSGGEGSRKGTVGEPGVPGGGGNSPSALGNGVGQGGGTRDAPRATDLPRGTSGQAPGLPRGRGSGAGIGDEPGDGKITLPIPGLPGSGPGNGGGPGELGGKRGVVKGQPGGVYVNTTGDFDVPLAVTSSNYEFNRGSVSKVIDEINGRTKVRVKLGTQTALIRSDQLSRSPVLLFNGHKPFKLSKQQRDALKAYVAGGGMIWADFTGDRFDDSFREEMMQIFGQELVLLGAGHPVYRSYYLLNQIPAGDTGSLAAFEGISQNGRVVVMATRNRYLGAVAGPPHVSEEVQEGAIQAVINIYLYAAQNFKASRE